MTTVNDSERVRVLLAMGTRPEVIKLAPVYKSIAAHKHLDPMVVLSGQHKEHVDEALDAFDLPIEMEFSVMAPRQGLLDLAPRLIEAAAEALEKTQPAYVVVQGDTLSTFVFSWAAFLRGIPVAHVEAGLRSGSIQRPFPEEANRRLTSAITDLDLAPTPQARANLVREGKDPDRIVVTGQTGIDAVRDVSARSSLPDSFPAGPYVTVTFHRRENWPILKELVAAVGRLATRHPDLRIVFPVHWNPAVREAVFPVVEGIPNVLAIDALPYTHMSALLRRSKLIITDSGGLQEEGVALGVPVVVAREVTERPEGVDSGGLFVAGTDPVAIFDVAHGLLSGQRFRATRGARNVYGDGKAGARVARAIAWRLGLNGRPRDWSPRTG